MGERIYSVKELNEYLMELMDGDPRLTSVFIRGEVSAYKVYPSGHHYFTLKDEGGALRCVMFRSYASRMRFKPRDGMKVIALGQVRVYPRDGIYQLYVRSITPDGIGELQAAFEQLKEKLYNEGLFDRAHKKPLPPMPMRIGVVTSSAGKAIHDITTVLNNRWPLAKVILLPVSVQGEQAPPEIAAAIRYANIHRVAEVLIVGRGGGSPEDLWCFNDERVARAIYASDIPVISAVGHEPDVTISDFVADVRAATPSNAAEIVAPDIGELRAFVEGSADRAVRAMEKRLADARRGLERYASARVLQDPRNYIDDRRLALDSRGARMGDLMAVRLASTRQRYGALAAKLDALSPLKVLSRGYSITLGPRGVVKSPEDVEPGDDIMVRLAGGEIGARVK